MKFLQHSSKDTPTFPLCQRVVSGIEPWRWPTLLLLAMGIGRMVVQDTAIAGDQTGDGASAYGQSLRRPNVVLILADDLGWSDTTLYGQTSYYRTPNIARLADRGMTFTRAYAASPLCSPTRASILTGWSPARHGITAPQCHLPVIRLEPTVPASAAAKQRAVQPNSVTRLATSHTTIAEVLRDAGYATGHFGKWHLGPEPHSPLEHGFDVDVPHWHGPGPAGSYVAPWKFPDFDHDPGVPNQHIEDRMALEAVKFMREHQNEPFFLNYWMFSVHAPFDAKAELVERYRNEVNTRDEQQCPTYAAMIESMDDAIGTLLDEIDRLGIADNTILIFASDNGGNAYSLVDDTRPTSNRPLRGGKATMWEGGLRTPAAIVWPGEVVAGSTSDALVQSMDYFPTLLEMLSVAPERPLPCDGVSLVPILRGHPCEREAIFTYFPHNPPVPDWIGPAISVHRDRWKLIRVFHDEIDDQHEHRLFDLADDIGETTDVSSRHPELVAELDALIEEHLQDTGAVVPQRNPAFRVEAYDPESEGRPAAKFVPGTAKKPQSPTTIGSPTKPGPPKLGPPVAGWRGGNCQLSQDDETLVIDSRNRDPQLRHRLVEPLTPGRYTLSFRLASTSEGTGQVFWKSADQPYAGQRSETFEITHDGSPHSYTVSFEPKSELSSIRFDPARGLGRIQWFDIRLLDASGQTVASWP